jgi:hypothetical protein
MAQKQKKYSCPNDGCKEEADYVGYAAEETLTENKPQIDISTLKAVQRDILVRCPVHGQKVVTKQGHHVDSLGPLQGAKVGGGWQKKRLKTNKK